MNINQLTGGWVLIGGSFVLGVRVCMVISRFVSLHNL
jgi:hypothetical protein